MKFEICHYAYMMVLVMVLLVVVVHCVAKKLQHFVSAITLSNLSLFE